MHPQLARRLYFTLQRFRHEPVAQALADVRRCEKLSLDELRALQAGRQLDQLRFALRHVPHYRRTLAPLADEIARARTWEQTASILARVPVVEKASVMLAQRQFTADNVARIPTHPDKTSGSSGTPLVFPCDQQAWAYRHALLYRCMENFGVKIGEPYALFFGLHWNRRTRLQLRVRDWVLNRVRVSAYDVSPARLDAHMASIIRARPTHFVGYPSAISDFCALLKERGRDLRSLGLKAVFLTSEPLRPHQRALIDEVTGSRSVDTYGSSEGGVLAMECPAGSLHTTPEATWLDVRNTNTHQGEVVATDLMLRAFPMIRYALGDEIVLREGRCACGRSQPMLYSIEGRAGDPIELPNGRRINANLPSYIFKSLAGLGVIRRYRFVQHGRSRIELQLVVASGFTADDMKIIERETRMAFGDDVAVEYRIVQELPHLANAKHRDFVRVA